MSDDGMRHVGGFQRCDFLGIELQRQRRNGVNEMLRAWRRR